MFGLVSTYNISKFRLLVYIEKLVSDRKSAQLYKSIKLSLPLGVCRAI